jgi:hypothetical protein
MAGRPRIATTPDEEIDQQMTKSKVFVKKGTKPKVVGVTRIGL